MKVLVFSNTALPDTLPLATRVINLAKILKEVCGKVDVLGVNYDRKSVTSGCYDGIEYDMLEVGSWSGLKKYKRINKLSKDIEAFLDKNTGNKPYDVILLSNVYYDLSNVFLAYAKKHGTKLIMNSVEWYDRNNAQFDGIFGKINFIKNRIALKKIHLKMGNIIAISSLLDDYYKSRGCNTVTIPTIIDLKEYESVADTVKTGSDEIHIAYAGNPGRKDYVLNAIYALELLRDEERRKIKLDFYGVTAENLCKDSLPVAFFNKYKDNIFCHGRIPYEKVKEKISEADFTILLRPNLRYANAGFPTKVGESMACGTPVICNLTSDLGKYIIDGETGIVCENESKEACAAAFRRAVTLTDEEKKSMRTNALNVAKKHFDYKAYKEAISKFLKKTEKY